jgi:hypothetical protein
VHRLTGAYWGNRFNNDFIKFVPEVVTASLFKAEPTKLNVEEIPNYDEGCPESATVQFYNLKYIRIAAELTMHPQNDNEEYKFFSW